MASITLTTLWLSSVATPSDSVTFELMSKMQEIPAVTGQVRQYANGRLRAVSQAGTTDTLAVTLPACTPDQVAWLRAHLNIPVLARDDRGRKVYGQFFSFQADEHQYDSNTDVTLTLTAISYDEAV